MAGIIPFRGYRYDPTKVGDVTSVVAPPYDRISPDVQAACYERSPFNVVRIIKGKEAPGDGPQENVYSRAAKHLRQWIDQGVLLREADPSLYAYHQTYTFSGARLTRKGIIALGKLEPEKVHAHEQTLKGPKEDRLRLMRATEANFGHIFMLYSDRERMADAAVAAAIDGRPPAVEATDGDGNLHSVWPIADREVIEIVQQALVDKDLYIADGHHRYETAVNFMRESEANGWRPAAPESFDVRMMTLFNIDEPGMSIRPIHRLVHAISGYDPETFLKQAGEAFIAERHGSLEEMVEAVGAGRDRHTLGCVTGGVFATLSLRDDIVLADFVPGDRSSDYKSLDVSILHAGILDRLLGIDARALEEQANVTYTVDPREGLAALAAGDEQILFYLNPTSADEVVRVADHGEKMPQKSTDFYPKLLTGLVLSTMKIEKPA